MSDPNLSRTHAASGPGLTRLAGIVPVVAQPGRYANAVTRVGHGQHALNSVRETLKSVFILNLSPAGLATLCRKWEFVALNDGPDIHAAERLEERFGYSGSWAPASDGLVVDLKRDDRACPPIATYTNLIPRHAERWRLHCAAYAPKDHPWLTAPFLACRLEGGPAFGEDEPHAIKLPDEGSLIFLGPGNGLLIDLDFDPTGTVPASPPRLSQASAPIEADSEAPPPLS